MQLKRTYPGFGAFLSEGLSTTQTFLLFHSDNPIRYRTRSFTRGSFIPEPNHIERPGGNFIAIQLKMAL